MLYITYRNHPEDHTTEVGWHVGDRLEVPYTAIVTEVTADGHELEFLLKEFPFLSTMTPKDLACVRFFGDTAMHIAHNLKHL